MAPVAIDSDSMEACALQAPASRRFYVHVGSFGSLVAAQPSIFREVAVALALSGSSRALDQVVQDWKMFRPSGLEPSLVKAAEMLHELAADALRTSFQCIVQLVPHRFGETELLLGSNEQINAWCYEDGYLTYATDESAAAIMYAETGSLRRLRSEIRRSPEFDPALQMISGHSLFLFDQKFGTGEETALLYKKQANRLLRDFHRDSLPAGLADVELLVPIAQCITTPTETFEGDSVVDTCLRRGHLMVSTLLRSLPTASAASPLPL